MPGAADHANALRFSVLRELLPGLPGGRPRLWAGAGDLSNLSIPSRRPPMGRLAREPSPAVVSTPRSIRPESATHRPSVGDVVARHHVGGPAHQHPEGGLEEPG